jgi:hypothetical protein
MHHPGGACASLIMEILECKEKNQQIVLSVFYKIDPSDVRNQKRSFGKALAKHKARFKSDSTVQSWKAGLNKVANWSGYHLKKGYFSPYIFIYLQNNLLNVIT